MLVVNLFGGPGAGKSLSAFGLTYELKRNGVNADFVPEYAKELVYGERWDLLANQAQVLWEQHRRLSLLNGKVDVAVLDGALLHSLVYAPEDFSADAAELTRSLWQRFDNMNFRILRSPKFRYEQAGRYQDEDTARIVDAKIASMLDAEMVDYRSVPSEYAVTEMLGQVLRRLRPSV